MKRLHSDAFEAADDFCDCKEGEECRAGAYSEGYIAGFEKARAEAAQAVRGSCPNDRYAERPFMDALNLLADDVAALGDEHVHEEEAYDRESHGAGGDGGLA